MVIIISDESLDKTINNLKNTIKNSKSGTATYYAQKALEGYQAEKERRKIDNEKNTLQSHLLFSAKSGMTNTGERDQEGGHLIDFSKTTYESINKTTDPSSYQYAILNDKFENGGYTYIDKNGLCRSSKIKGQKSSDDYYVVAMGNKFEQCAKSYDNSYDKNTAEAMAKNNSGKILNYTSNKTVNVGYTFRVDLMDANGNTYSIDVLMADSKGDSNSFIPHDNVVEFFVDGKPNSQICSVKEKNIDYAALVGASSKTSIQSISIYENSARYTGVYATNGWKRI